MRLGGDMSISQLEHGSAEARSAYRHLLTLGLKGLGLGRTLYLWGVILEGLPRLLGAINTGGIFDAVPFSLPPSLTEEAFIEF